MIFDVLSHEFMHHPFNEAYLRLLRAAFPEDRIVFHAQAAHLARLAPRLTDEPAIRFVPIEPLRPPKGWSLHNPVVGRLAALRVWRQMRLAIASTPPRLVAVLGFDANLLSVLRRVWRGPTPLHLILHNQIAAAMHWRSRNPAIRAFDLLAVMRQGLPPSLRVMTLELGIAEAVRGLAPAWAGNLATLEHPILVSEWVAPSDPAAGMLHIGFLGHASRDKGFDLFLDIAHTHASPAMRFHAIGIASPEALAMDLRCLARPPSPTSVPRPDYVAAVAQMDFVCLPLNENYRYVASGSVIDAVAACKPLLSVRNDSLDAIESAYGPIGATVAAPDALRALFAAPGAMLERRSKWVANLQMMRAARTPRALARNYARLLEAS
jgi:hypothetical protein